MTNSIPSSINFSRVAEMIKGTVVGNADGEISGVQPLELAGPTDLSFFAPRSARNEGYVKQLLLQTRAAAVLVKNPVPELERTQIVVSNPYGAAIVLLKLFHRDSARPTGIHPTAVVAPTAKLEAGVAIGAYAVIGERVEIGANSVIHPHAVIYDDVTIGADCVIHANVVVREFSLIGNDCWLQPGAVVGGDGFGYLPNPQTGHERIPHTGRAVLENRVDLGANATVDRATFGETRIGAGTKIDNLVMIGHNVTIGKNGFLCSQVGISGSVTVGNNVILAGQVGVADHVKIGDNVRAAARTGITGNIEGGQDIGGFPAQTLREWRRETATIRRLSRSKKKTDID